MLLAIAAAAAVVFAVTPVDLAAARLFYRPGLPNPWPLAKRLPWSVLYGAAPWITAALVLAGLAALAVGALRGRDRLRRHGVWLLLTVVAGPGLTVNLLFKDHWGRPRPRDVVVFGGTSAYVPPLVPSRRGGASFPCGHCSVGFLGAAGWWVWRRTRRGRAWASLGVGTAAGFALGLGRMAAGGHFLSDVVWSALLALGIAHVLHDYVLRVDATRPGPATRASPREVVLAALAACGGIAVLAAVFAVPHGTALSARLPLPPPPRAPWAFELVARKANVTIVLAPEGSDVAVDGELHGFGLPWSALTAESETVPGGVPVVRYRIVQRGWFTDLDGSATVRLPVDGLARVTVRVDRGDVRVRDLAPPGEAVRPVLDLHTGYGRVLAPPGTPPRSAG